MKNYRIEIKWTFIFAATALSWMLLERLVGLHGEHIDQHATYTNFFSLPAVTIFFLALRDKRNNYFQGEMTYKDGFMTGAVITLMIAVLSPLTQFITTTIITPDYFQNVIEYSISEGLAIREEAEHFFNLKNYIIQGVLGAVVMGIITTSILAFFTRSKGTS